MAEPEKPELEAVAVAWLNRETDELIALAPPERHEAFEREDEIRCVYLCLLPAAQALLAKQADRIAELEQALSNEEQHLRNSGNRIAELESGSARWRKVARAAVQLQQSGEWASFWNAISSFPPPGRFGALSNAVDALSEPEREELLKERS